MFKQIGQFMHDIRTNWTVYDIRINWTNATSRQIGHFGLDILDWTNFCQVCHAIHLNLFFADEIKRLAEEHQEELEMFLKEQENSHKRIKGELQEKLMKRRQRRARMRVEEKERQMLTS